MQDLDNESIIIISNGKLSEIELEKIFALKAIKANTRILDNVLYFEKLVYVLNGIKPNVWSFEPVTVLHLCKAFEFLHKEFPKRTWNREVLEYIAHIAFEEGWHTLPTQLAFAQNALNILGNGVTLDEEQIELQKLKHQAVGMYLQEV
jgi:hypothetical protein